MTMTSSKFLALSLALTLAGCATAPQPQPDTRAADEAAIRKLDEEWVKAGQTKKADAWVAFYSDDAVILPPNAKTAAGKADITKAIDFFLSLPGLELTWKIDKIEVARSGDLAYGYGMYDMTMNDAKGKPVKDQGKMVEIWKKQADGGWKCIVDIWNSDLPATPPASK